MDPTPSRPDTGARHNRSSPAGTPRWVKVFGIVALVVVVVFVVVLLTRGPGGHGPGRHTSSGDAAPQPTRLSGSSAADGASQTTLHAASA